MELTLIVVSTEFSEFTTIRSWMGRYSTKIANGLVVLIEEDSTVLVVVLEEPIRSLWICLGMRHLRPLAGWRRTGLLVGRLGTCSPAPAAAAAFTSKDGICGG